MPHPVAAAHDPGSRRSVDPTAAAAMSTDTFTWKRRKHTAACADNIPLLHEMVRLYDDAKLSDANAAAGAGAGAAKAGGHSKMAAAYGKAIDSLAKYPLQITSAEEAEELQGGQESTSAQQAGGALLERARLTRCLLVALQLAPSSLLESESSSSNLELLLLRRPRCLHLLSWQLDRPRLQLPRRSLHANARWLTKPLRLHLQQQRSLRARLQLLPLPLLHLHPRVQFQCCRRCHPSAACRHAFRRRSLPL